MKYFLYGYFGFNNFGDDLLLEKLLKNIKKRDKKAFFYIRNKEKIDFLKNENNIELTCLESIIYTDSNIFYKLFSYLKKSFNYINKSDIFVIGPGGLFLDKGKVNKSIIVLYLLVKYASFKNKKIVIVGTSFDIIANPFNLFLLKKIFLLSSFISVRDSISYAYLKYMNIPNIVKSYDLVFLDIENKVFSVDMLKKKKRATIGLCFTDYYKDYEEDEIKRKKFLSKILKLVNLLQDNYNLTYISLQEDNEVRDDVIYDFLISKNIKIEYINLNMKNHKSFFDNYEVILTMRYHLALLGFIENKHIVIIDHEIKMSSLKLDFDIQSISIDDFIETSSVEKVRKMIEIRERSKMDIDNYIKKSLENFKWLK